MLAPFVEGDPENKKGKKKKSRGKGKGADDKNVGDAPEQFGAPPSYPPSTYNAWAYSNPYYMQPYGASPAVAQGYPAPPSILPPQQPGSAPGPPFPGQLAIPGPPPSSYLAQVTGQMQLLPQPAWKESNANQELAHSNYSVSPHNTW